MEYGDASGTGLLNVRTRDWCNDLIDFVGPSMIDMIPEIQSSMNIHGEVRSEVLKELLMTLKNYSKKSRTIFNLNNFDLNSLSSLTLPSSKFAIFHFI